MGLIVRRRQANAAVAKLHRVRLELRPARPDAWPLREIKDWDVLRGFVPPLEQVRVPQETLTVSVDLLPVAPRRMMPERHRILSSIRQGEVHDPLVTDRGPKRLGAAGADRGAAG